MFGAVRKRLEHVLYDDFDSGRRDFLKLAGYTSLGLAGVPFVSGCLGRDTRVTPAPTVAPHVQFFRDNPELSYGFTARDEDWARNSYN